MPAVWHGFDDAIVRGFAFRKNSALTPVFVEAPQSESELEEIPRRVTGVPLLVNVFKGGKTPMLPAERLQKMGYRIAIYPSETQRAAIHAMRQVLGLLKREGTTEAMDASLTTFKERDKSFGLDDWQKIEKTVMAVGYRGNSRSFQKTLMDFFRVLGVSTVSTLKKL